MTVARSKRQPSRAARAKAIAAIRAEIRGAGIRSTAARIAVVERLRCADVPLSNAQIAAALLPMGFDRATIYRNVVDLAAAGLLLRVELGDHISRYEPSARYSRRRDGHPHFVCRSCGRTLCLEKVRVSISPAASPQEARVAEIAEVILRGSCDRCSHANRHNRNDVRTTGSAAPRRPATAARE